MPLPYSVSVHPDTGYYIFTTDYGLIYACGFKDITRSLSPIFGIYEMKIFDFEFYPIQEVGARKIKDDRIPVTICDLITKFFNNPLRVLIYVCDASDGKHRGRQWLFNYWHRSFMSTIIRNQLDIEFENEGFIYTTHGAVLTRDDFPHQDVLQNELLDQARGIMLEKFGQ